MQTDAFRVEALRQGLRKAVAAEERLTEAEEEFQQVVDSIDALDSSEIKSIRISFTDARDEIHTLEFDYADAFQIRALVRTLLKAAVQRRRIEVLERTVELQQKL